MLKSMIVQDCLLTNLNYFRLTKLQTKEFQPFKTN